MQRQRHQPVIRQENFDLAGLDPASNLPERRDADSHSPSHRRVCRSGLIALETARHRGVDGLALAVREAPATRLRYAAADDAVMLFQVARMRRPAVFLHVGRRCENDPLHRPDAPRDQPRVRYFAAPQGQVCAAFGRFAVRLVEV